MRFIATLRVIVNVLLRVIVSLCVWLRVCVWSWSCLNDAFAFRGLHTRVRLEFDFSLELTGQCEECSLQFLRIWFFTWTSRTVWGTFSAVPGNLFFTRTVHFQNPGVISFIKGSGKFLCECSGSRVSVRLENHQDSPVCRISLRSGKRDVDFCRVMPIIINNSNSVDLTFEFKSPACSTESGKAGDELGGWQA